MKDTVNLMGDDGYLLFANGSIASDNDSLVEDEGDHMKDTVDLTGDDGYLVSAYH